MNVLLLAAGLGTRLRPTTEKIPKPSLPLLNVPLLGYGVHLLSSVPVKRWVVNLHHLPEKVRATAQAMCPRDADLQFSDETKLILGSGGGIAKARSRLISGGSFLYANADEVLLPEDPLVLDSLRKQHEIEQNIATILVMSHPLVGTKFGGVWTDEKRNVIGFGKTPPPSGARAGWHFVGYQMLRDDVFSYLRDDCENNIFYDGLVRAIADGHRVRVFPIEAKWFEVGNGADFLEVTGELLSILASPNTSPEKTYLERLVKVRTPESHLQVSEQSMILIEKTASLDARVRVEGFCVMGANSKISGTGAIRNLVVAPHVTSAVSTQIENQILV